IRFLKDKKHEPLLILLFILPGTPKDLLCYFAGLTNIKTMTWIIVSSLGRIPSIVTSTIGGDAIERENYGWAIVAFAVAMLISIFGIIIYRAIHRKHNKQDSSEKCVDEK
ncbi:MAG: TVP38/TMEM64 family protein, partial [Lachnospiraceae bacterium]|nr:TVP38/TMEM64 family protein [Lachnospiraceae bacterium]